MVADAVLLAQIEQFAAAGADLVSFHVENAAVAGAALDLLDTCGVAAGLVLKVETPLDGVARLLPRLRFLTLLGTSIGVKEQGYDDVRIDERSLFAKLQSDETVEMGFVSFNTINFPRSIKASDSVEDAAWLIHELTHVWQYQNWGSGYLAEKIKKL